MIEEKRCPKCGRKEKVKNGFMRGKQRYKCKNCGCNYTGGRNGYPEDIKQKAIKYYLEGNGFRRIERLLHVSHVSVINWVKQAADEIRKKRKFNNKKTNILELDEMCINFKKNLWLWTAVSRTTKKLVGFLVGDRSSESFEKLCENISHIKAKREMGWNFIFFGANIDSNKEAESLGIDKKYTGNFEATAKGMQGCIGNCNRMIFCMR